MNVTRKLAAILIADELQIIDFNSKLLNYKGLENLDSRILALLSRNIFGAPFDGYDFRGNDNLTRYELSKLSLEIFAYLNCTEYYNLEPGSKDGITDIDKLKPLQRWYIHSAIKYGFVDAENAKFNPFNNVSLEELMNMLNKVISSTNKKPLALDMYEAERLASFKAAPINKNGLGEYIYIYNRSYENRGYNILASSLQGIVNREKAIIATNFSCHKEYERRFDISWIFEYAKENKYIKGIKGSYDNPYELLIELKNEYSLDSFIVYDEAVEASLSCIYNIAAVEEALIITEDMVDDIKEIIPDAKFIYMKELGLSNLYDYIAYSYNNYFEYMRRDALNIQYPKPFNDLCSDYPIALKIPSIWITGEQAADYDPRELTLAEEICREYPTNIPIMGFYYGPVYENRKLVCDSGITEFKGVQLFGEYGKYTCVMSTCGNLSIFTAFSIDSDKLKFNNQLVSNIEYDKNKKYVALCMSESGDSPMYIIVHLKEDQWDNDYREIVPFNYSYGLCNYDLLPIFTEYFAKTATKNNYFYGAISGIGYNYPALGFGKRGEYSDDGQCKNEADVLKEHYMKANSLLKKLGFDAMAIYERPDRDLNALEKEALDNNVLKYMTECKSVMLDMHRPYEASDYKKPRHINGRSYFNNATFWSFDDLGNPASKEYDEKAVDFLYNEIIKNTQDGQFFQCMALSWHYGPRRLKLAMDRIKRDYPNYEFVTINELDAYFIEYLKKEKR